ncbi:MAG: hypothetical protein U0R76_16110 [Candidatus Nanopelagicales bacterium]
MALHQRVESRVSDLHVELGPPPWRSARLVEVGWTPSQIRRAVESGALTRLTRGVLSPAAAASQLEVVRALLEPLASHAACSHETAADLNEQWFPRRRDELIHVTVSGRPERTDGRLRVHGSRLSDAFVVEMDGVRVTTVARTAMDLGRGRSFPDALVALDGAARRIVTGGDPDVERSLRLRLLPAEVIGAAIAELEAAYTEVWSWPGTRVLRQALDKVDPRSESPFESWSRGCLLDSGAPPFEINAPVRGASGRLYFGDFVWRRERLIGEADGMSKYGVTAGQQRRALQDQRAREDDLIAVGWRFVRWVTGEPARTLTSRVAVAVHRDPRVTA